MNIQNWLKYQDLPLRTDCPQCGNRNTFSARQGDTGEIWYKCFHADCNLRGKIDVTLSLDTINNLSTVFRPEILDQVWKLPEHFTSPLQNTKSLAFLRRWHLLEKYANGLELYYDPRQNRVVFPLRDDKGVLKGATGRSLDYRMYPKWYIYERIAGQPYISSSLGTKCIIVEDCISACHVSHICSSISLLGTNWDICFSRIISKFSKVYVALDDDASSKAIKLQKEINLIVPTETILLRKDLKYYSNLELEQLKWRLDLN